MKRSQAFHDTPQYWRKPARKCFSWGRSFNFKTVMSDKVINHIINCKFFHIWKKSLGSKQTLKSLNESNSNTGRNQCLTGTSSIFKTCIIRFSDWHLLADSIDLRALQIQTDQPHPPALHEKNSMLRQQQNKYRNVHLTLQITYSDLPGFA